jgi:hypothetical protein
MISRLSRFGLPVLPTVTKTSIFRSRLTKLRCMVNAQAQKARIGGAGTSVAVRVEQRATTSSAATAPVSQLVCSCTDEASALSKDFAHHRACLDGEHDGVATIIDPLPLFSPFAPGLRPCAMQRGRVRVAFLVACQSWLDRHKAGAWPSLAQTQSPQPERNRIQVDHSRMWARTYKLRR